MIMLATTQALIRGRSSVAWEDLLAGIEIDGCRRRRTTNRRTQRRRHAMTRATITNDELANDEASFVGPNFGFSVAVDESVWAIRISRMRTTTSSTCSPSSQLARSSASTRPMTPGSCLELLISLKVGDTALAFDVAPDSMERPKLTAGATGELFVYSVEGEDGPIDLTMYVECRRWPVAMPASVSCS